MMKTKKPMNGWSTHAFMVAGLLGILGVSGLGASVSFASVPQESIEHISYAEPRSWYEAHVNLAEPERERIQKHLAEAEADMRSNPPAGLNSTQMKNRLALLDSLREYRLRGEFPKNLDFPDRLIPYFIDAAGVPCAMGQLIIASGHASLAEDVRATMNNAYVPEIAAADPRLAAWGAEHGITLEEAARVQPGYGAPVLNSVYRVSLDSLGRPWVLGRSINDVAVIGNWIGYRDTTWVLPGYASGFCTVGKEALVLQNSSANWKARSYSIGVETGYRNCEWAPNGSEAWVGSRRGLIRFRRGGSSDTLAIRTFSTPLASDTVIEVAVTGDAVWAATPRGVYRRGRVGSDTAVTAYDSLALWGKRISAIRASGNRVWLGVEGGAFAEGELPKFSTRGLRRFNGTGWSAFVASQSFIQTPGDTIYALAVRDTGSVWVATPTFGFARFNGTTTTKVADIPTGVTVYDMAGDTAGFYAGTSNGVYRYTGGILTHMGFPATSLRPGLITRRAPVNPQLQSRLRGTHSGEASAVTVLGRQAGAHQAAGVYYAPTEHKQDGQNSSRIAR